MQKGGLVIFLLLTCSFCFAQADTIQARIVLIGDAGQFNYGRAPVIDAARDSIPLDSRTTVLYLGDNIYDSGLPDDFMPGYRDAKEKLDSQLAISKGTKAEVIFIPGNHDWNNADPNGPELVNRQEAYIKSHGADFFPSDGCPGPVAYDINKDVVLVMYDSQWFIRKDGNKPGIESDCPYKTEDEFYNELDDMLSRNSDKLVILAGHHTLKSYGIHGGYFPIKQFLFPLTDMNPKLMIPLPIIGIIYPIARGVFGTPEDLRYPAYANMIAHVQRVARKHQNVIFVGGHEHTLQLIKDSSYYYIVSGAGSKSTRVSNSRKTLYTEQSFGFADLVISKNKNVHIDFYTVNQDSVSHSFSKNLFNFSTLKKDTGDISGIPKAVPVVSFKDSVTVAVNPDYQKISSLHKIFAGENYRKEWAAPVHLKVFRIEKEKGGFTILSLGGGKQTRSLRLQDKYGQQWVLRTVDKYPEGTVPELLKTNIDEKIMKDMVSAEHPYGALIVPLLADAALVEHAEPTYYFVPDDPALKLYRSMFANKICMLEKYDPTTDESNTKSTAKVINKLIDDSKNHVEQDLVLR
ncbi:MAG: metallophosphoesterase, partial [Bacteroidota bacterium]|nr:metallophosphoesterase [Bacteroidota bacterium]